MLTRLRRSAGMLLVLFGGHLTMVTEGVVCTTPGMAPMSPSVAQPASMAAMPDMAIPATSDAERASPEHAPCSSPSQSTCVASMPCVTALGAPQAEGLVCPFTALPTCAIALAVTMPVTSGSAPELPPPRA